MFNFVWKQKYEIKILYHLTLSPIQTQKFKQATLTRYLAFENAPKGILCTLLCSIINVLKTPEQKQSFIRMYTLKQGQTTTIIIVTYVGLI